MNTAESLGNGAGLGARPAIQFHDAAGHRSFGSYLRWLEQSGAQTKQEWQEFVNCLTTNLTAFFREQHHFPVFGTELIKHTSGRYQLI